MVIGAPLLELGPTPPEVVAAVIEGVRRRGHDPTELHVDRLIALVAAVQDNVIAHEQLVTLGCARGAIAYRVRRGMLRPVHRGVYLYGQSEPTLATRAHAAVFACRGGTLVSHHAAAARWAVRPQLASPVDVTVIGRRLDVRGIRIHQTTGLHRDDVRVLHGIPTTAPARTLLDIAPDLTARELAAAVERAQVRRLVTREEILAALDRVPGRPGSRALRALVTDPVFTRSEAERLLVRLLRAAKLPRPQFNATVEGFEVDAVWRTQRVILEFDSYAFHATRAAFERDRSRDAVHTRARYTTLRATWREVHKESHALIARVAEALARA